MVKQTGDILGDKAPKPSWLEKLIVFLLVLILFVFVLSRTGLLAELLRWAGVE